MSQSMKVSELRSIAKEKGLKGYSSANKSELLMMLESGASLRELRLQDKTQAEEEEESPQEVIVEEVEVVQQVPPQSPKSPPSPKSPQSPNKKPRQRKRNAWNAYLSSQVKKTGCSLSEARADKEAYAKFKASFDPNA